MGENDEEGCIHLECDDGLIFSVPREVAMVSSKLNECLTDNESSDEDVIVSISVAGVTSDALRNVLSFCRDVYISTQSEEDRFTTKWQTLVGGMNSQAICNLTTAAYVLGVRPLVDITCHGVAELLTGRNAEEISSAFDFLPPADSTALDTSTEDDKIGGGASKKKKRKRKKKRTGSVTSQSAQEDNTATITSTSSPSPSPLEAQTTPLQHTNEATVRRQQPQQESSPPSAVSPSTSLKAAAITEGAGAGMGEGSPLGGDDELELFRRTLENAHLNAPPEGRRIRITVPSSFKFSKKYVGGKSQGKQ